MAPLLLPSQIPEAGGRWERSIPEAYGAVLHNTPAVPWEEGAVTEGVST